MLSFTHIFETVFKLSQNVPDEHIVLIDFPASRKLSAKQYICYGSKYKLVRPFELLFILQPGRS